MIRLVKVPRLNANEDQLLVSAVDVEPGERVEEGQVLGAVESSKSSSDIEAPAAGWIRRIDGTEGEMLDVGAPLFVLSDAADEPLDADEPIAPEAASDPAPKRLTAKERLLAKRRGASAAPPPPDSSSELPWVRAMRAALAAECGPVGEAVVVTASERPERGVFIGEGATIAEGARVECKRLYLGAHAAVGPGTVLRGDDIYLGAHTRVGPRVSMFALEILIDDGVLVADQAVVDVSGGLNPDSRLLVGAASLISGSAYLNVCREILLEPESAVSPRAMLFTHSFWQSVLDGHAARFAPIAVRKKGWVGAGCQVLPGVTVGRGATAISNSTVVEDVPDGSVVGGVPAKVLRKDARRTLGVPERVRILEGVLEEFLQYLEFKGCSIRRVDARRSVVSREAYGPRELLLATPATSAPQLGAPDVVAVSLGAQVAAGDGRTVFDIDGGVLTGPEDELVFELRHFLRRRGIRFAPAGWDADHRRGFPRV